MNKIILLIFAISVVFPSESLSQETCEEKLAMVAEICLQKAEEAYSSVVEDALNEGFDALNATDLYHYRGIEALIRSYDMRIDATVVSLDDLLTRPVSAELKERAETFLSRTKKIRESYPSTAQDTKFYKKAIDILSRYEPSIEDNPDKLKTIRERLEELRRMSEERRAK